MRIKIVSACVLALSTLSIIHPAHASGMIQVKPSYVASNFAETKYPIMMAHGFALGFNRLGTTNFGIDQFYQITPDLARNGASVFVAQMSPVESTSVRGEQLLQQVDTALAITGKDKVNLIGHSHGGPTIRYIEAVAPQKVASLTSVAGSIKGAPLGEALMNTPVISSIGKIVIGQILPPALAIMQGNPDLSVDYERSIYDISEKGAAEFNRKYPSAAIPQDCQSAGAFRTDNGVYHYSWTGNAKVTNILDVLDSSIVALGTAIMPSIKEHDGLVPVCNSNYGRIIRNDYRLNHFDEINQFLGLKGLFAPDPVTLFRQHANRLKLQGL